MSPADKLEQNQNAEMLAEAMGGPSQAEQAAQAAANPSLAKRRGASKPAPAVLNAELPPATMPTATAVILATEEAPTTSVSTVVPSSPPSATGASATKIFFTGRSGIGKTFLAQLIGAKIREFHQPLSALWTGAAPSPAELQRLIAWANGVYDEKNLNTLERVLFVHAARSGLLGGIELPLFGQPNFLVRYLVQEAAGTDGILAVTDVQTKEDFQVLRDAGFKHFHVVCSQTTMASRNKRQRDERLAQHLDSQASTVMQKEPRGDKKPVIWCDPISPLPCERFYSVAEFKALFIEAPAEPIEGIEL